MLDDAQDSRELFISNFVLGPGIKFAIEDQIKIFHISLDKLAAAAIKKQTKAFHVFT